MAQRIAVTGHVDNRFPHRTPRQDPTAQDAAAAQSDGSPSNSKLLVWFAITSAFVVATLVGANSFMLHWLR